MAKLYRDFTSQAEIDREYDAAAAVPDSAALIERWTQRSEATRGHLEARLDLKYGPTAEEYLDFFPAGPRAPVHLFIHGGYWRRFSARETSFVAEPLVAAGISTACLNYALCPTVTVDEIVRQVRAAVAWIWRHADELDVDRTRLTVSGHSAGGQLTAMTMLTDWPGDYDLPRDVVTGALAISGVFDLAPLRSSWLQPVLRLGEDEVRRNSPILHEPPAGASLTIAVGAEESGEFRRQSRDLVARWSDAGARVNLLELEGRNHFTVLEEIETEVSRLLATITELSRLTPA